MKIAKVTAQELLDSRGNPTVEAIVILENGLTATAMVPSGASTGIHEALELRDGNPRRYLGRGVLQAVAHVNEMIAPAVVGRDVTDQAGIDNHLLEIDGTPNKSKVGANAILSVSIACLKAGALAEGIPFFEYVASLIDERPVEKFTMPIPMMNVLNGGKHAEGSADLQEYMIMPIGAPSIVEAVRWGAEIFHHLGKIIQKKGWPTTVGDEGGYAPPVHSNEQPLQLIMEAMEQAGYTPGTQIGIALDPAASELHQDDRYHLDKDGRKDLTSDEMVELYVEWAGKYPIVSIEDGLAEEDWDGFAHLKQQTNDAIQIVGDDLFVTNVERVEMGIRKKAANSVLIKVNQIGTITESLQTIKLARQNDMTCIISHRSGETELPFEADFAVGTHVGQIKIGSLSRSERVAEYNQLMRIERELGDRAQMACFAFLPEPA
ncbi:MAG TPA: phosphopyruvate hydratase [Phycisphaerales bacterium]|nr:phosphopyruvate hydratase [Phycisphaerales bacterium]